MSERVKGCTCTSCQVCSGEYTVCPECKRCTRCDGHLPADCPGCAGSDDPVGRKYKVLNHGHVILRGVFGTDQDIVNAARISYHEDSNRKVTDDAGLLDYLMRHHHTSPFEMVVFRFQVKLPIFVERQWVRHRTCSMNEMSARYSELPAEYYQPDPDTVRAQSTVNKQGRDQQLPSDTVVGFRDDVALECGGAFPLYKLHLELGVARELARIILPLGTYTEKVWQMNLHNLLHFLKLRSDEHAQWAPSCCGRPSASPAPSLPCSRPAV